MREGEKRWRGFVANGSQRLQVVKKNQSFQTLKSPPMSAQWDFSFLMSEWIDSIYSISISDAHLASNFFFFFSNVASNSYHIPNITD